MGSILLRWATFLLGLACIIGVGLQHARYQTVWALAGFASAVAICLALDILVVDRAISHRVYPYFRDGILFFGLWKHSGRQQFHVGTLSPGRTPAELLECLRDLGFENDALAWVDDGEIVSVRKRFGKGRRFQHHIRLFGDGELRGHKEYSPEFAPVKHILEVGFEPAEAHFEHVIAGMMARGSPPIGAHLAEGSRAPHDGIPGSGLREPKK